MIESLLAKIGAALNRRHIPYMLIGGQAVLLYGEPRLTQDIDITLGVDVDMLAEIKDVCKRTGLSIPKKIDDAFVRDTNVLVCLDKTSKTRIDFIFSFTSYEKAAIKRARSVRIKGQPVNFASIEDLIVHKILAGRPRDIEDVEGILKRHKKIDLKYIRKKLNEFSKIADSDTKIIGIFELLFKKSRQINLQGVGKDAGA